MHSLFLLKEENMNIIQAITKKRAFPDALRMLSKRGKLKSAYNRTDLIPYSEVNSTVATALFKYQKIREGVTPGGIAIDTNGRYLVEYYLDNDQIELAVYNSKNGTVMAAIYDMDSKKIKEYKMESNDMSLIVLSILPIALENEEAGSAFNQIAFSFLYSKEEEDWKQFTDYIGLISDNVISRLKAGTIKNSFAKEESFQCIPPNTINANSFEVAEELCGRIRFFKKIEYKKPSEITPEEFNGRYKYSTIEFKQEVAQIGKTYYVPEKIVEICQLIQSSTGMESPLRDVLLIGDSGSGKTEGCRAIAAGLGLPYVTYTCHPQTDNFDLVGQFVPATDGENSDKREFKFVPSEIIEAIKNGYLVEIQEPTVIVNEGVLVGLNSILAGGYIRLANGERVQRHPDSVICFTTNKASYAGYGNLSNSVLSRCSLVYQMDTPSIDEMVLRAMKKTEIPKKEKGIVEKMATCIYDVAEKAKDAGISDGVTGFRELISWINCYRVLGDAVKAAYPTVINKSSFDDDFREEVEDMIINVFN